MLEIAKIIDQKLQYPCLCKFLSYHRALVHFNFISSQYSLHLCFASARLFHCLHHPWLSTVLLKAHHSISLHFCLALHLHTSPFLSQISCHTSGHIALRHKPRLAPWLSPLLPFYTHTHSLSLSLIFPSASCYFGFSISVLAFSPSVTPPALCHTLRLRVTPSGFASHPWLYILLSPASTYL